MKKLLAVPLALVLGSALAQEETAPEAAPSDNRWILDGEGMPVNGGLLSTWAELGLQGEILSVGITMPMGMLQDLPTSEAAGPLAVLEFPKVAQELTFFNNFQLYWETAGHEPARYKVPHFDMHLFSMPVDDVAKIDCSDLTIPDPADISEGYAPVVPPNMDAKNFCVPMMGFHSVALSELTPDATAFDKTIVHGYYNGQFTFLEPMITPETLMKKENFAFNLAKPINLSHPMLYPTIFRAVYDADNDSYNFTFENFELYR